METLLLLMTLVGIAGWLVAFSLWIQRDDARDELQELKAAAKSMIAQCNRIGR